MTLLSAFGIIFVMIDPFSIAYYHTEDQECYIFEKTSAITYELVSEKDLTHEQLEHITHCSQEKNLKYKQFPLDKYQ